MAGVICLPESFDIRVFRFLLFSHSHGITHIIVACIDQGVSRQGHEALDGPEEGPVIAGKAVAHRAVKQGVPGEQDAADMETYRVLRVT